MRNRRPEPAEVREARDVLRSTREHLALVGGVATVAGLAVSAAGFAVALPIAAGVVGLCGALYKFPVARDARIARRTIVKWTETGVIGRGPASSVSDDRITTAELMMQRVEDYSGAHAPSTAAARDMVQLLYDSVEDLNAAEQLRHTRGEKELLKFRRLADSLTARINSRMDQAVSVVAEIYDAVLAQDDVALREVVARAGAEARRLHAETEVNVLLQGYPSAEVADQPASRQPTKGTPESPRE